MNPLEQILARLREAADELTELRADNYEGDLDDEARNGRIDELLTETDDLMVAEAREREIDERRNAIAAAVERGTVTLTPSVDPLPVPGVETRDPFNLGEFRSSNKLTQRTMALDAAEQARGANDDQRSALVGIIESSTGHEARELIVTTGSDAYMQAFGKAIAGREAQWTTEERDAMLQAEPYRQRFNTESRAMTSGTTTSGGFLVPEQLDPSIILTAAGSINMVREACARRGSVVTATGNQWKGVSSAGVTSSWDAEAAEVSDDSPTVAQPTVDIHMNRLYAQYSFEYEGDAANGVGELLRLFAFEKDRSESVAHVTGSGSGQPTGFVTALAGSASEVETAGSGAFAKADPLALKVALPLRFRVAAEWFGNGAIENAIRGFDTAGGAAFWVDFTEGTPSNLIGRPWNEAEAMSGTISAGEDILTIGDYGGYVIADRVGFTVETVQHVIATANNRPTGERGLLGWYRTGANVVNVNAFRQLTVKA